MALHGCRHARDCRHPYDAVELGGNAPGSGRIITQAEAEAKGWFNGPPYAVAEVVFDEYDLEGCDPISDIPLRTV